MKTAVCVKTSGMFCLHCLRKSGTSQALAWFPPERGTQGPRHRAKKAPFESKQIHNCENKEEVGIWSMWAFLECWSIRTKSCSDGGPGLNAGIQLPDCSTEEKYQIVNGEFFSQ